MSGHGHGHVYDHDHDHDHVYGHDHPSSADWARKFALGYFRARRPAASLRLPRDCACHDNGS
jgi:hypothetical protein